MVKSSTPNPKTPRSILGDFNCHYVSWGYSTNDENGESLSNWMDKLDLHLIYDAKDLKTFHSARWPSDTNPDLCFVTTDSSQVPLPHTRKVMRSFPRSQHRPVIINIGIQVPVIKSTPKPRWNFRKADWATYSKKSIHTYGGSRQNQKHGRFAGVLIGSAKRNIPRGYRK
ncbi:hypothetical protein JTB14_032269 [Gonioctena quinquepunctata]|nr:hypothetical protein JTB14_032269 [Gonioctena quinquepunctata]